MKRPLRSRIWFWKPDIAWDRDYWLKESWKLFSFGSDEFDWHTILVGFPWTGRVIFASRKCPRTGKCREFWDEMEEWAQTGHVSPDMLTNEWPVDMYGWDHSKSDLENAWGPFADVYDTPQAVFEDYPVEWMQYHDARCSAGEFCTVHTPGAPIEKP